LETGKPIEENIAMNAKKKLEEAGAIIEVVKSTPIMDNDSLSC
jgi:hypothetical protein